MTFFRKSTLALAALSVAITPAMPAMAVNMGATASARETGSILVRGTENDYRRRYHHRRHHGHIDGGDVLAGIGILAGIAIIASAASDKNKRRSPDRYPDVEREEYPQTYPPQNGGSYNNDISSAVGACTAAVEQSGDGPVEEIRSVGRDGAGWRVEGQLGGNDDRGFSCGVTNGGVDFIQYDDR